MFVVEQRLIVGGTSFFVPETFVAQKKIVTPPSQSLGFSVPRETDAQPRPRRWLSPRRGGTRVTTCVVNARARNRVQPGRNHVQSGLNRVQGSHYQ